MTANDVLPAWFPLVCKSSLPWKFMEGLLSPPEAAAPVKTLASLSRLLLLVTL